MAPLWLSVLGWAAIGTAALSAGWIGFDVLVRRRHQHMRIMEVVWPVTALYFGPLGIWGYRRFGLPASIGWSDEHPSGAPRAQPTWAGVATDVSHCGAGCTLGDLIAEWCVFGIGATIAGRALLPDYIGDYLAALTLGIFFQYFAVAPMRGSGCARVSSRRPRLTSCPSPPSRSASSGGWRLSSWSSSPTPTCP